MKKSLSIVILLTITVLSYSQGTRFQTEFYSFIENTGVFELNQEEGHTPVVPYSTGAEALAGNRDNSKWIMMLNGPWKFHYANTPEQSPAGFYMTEFNDRSWNSIPVPSNWEMQGYGDPIFRNISTSFRPDPPRVPREYNPTGSYRRTFTLPPAWQGREVFLRMEKTASASFVWINGKEAGYNEGAQEPAEYNITSLLKPGRNTIAVMVIKYSDGYYLEDQDYWRLAGIFDDVWLYAAPGQHIFDWHAVTDLDENYLNAELKLDALIRNFNPVMAEGLTLRTSLYDRDKVLVSSASTGTFNAGPESSTTVSLSIPVSNPAKWSAEKPNLYHIVLELNRAGKIIGAVSGRIGFKETKIEGQVFSLNGVPVKLNAINSHMQHPVTGHTMDENTIRKDLEIFKRFNINCVRTSHYPPVTRYLELADEYGIYVVDETGDEAHATEYLSRNPEWEEMYRERARKMVLRDRNHPSVLFWSAGNESGEGDNICAVIEEGKKYDNTRFWMYGGNAFAHHCEDIIGPRYPQLHNLVKNVFLVPDSIDPRPSFLDEYLAVTGNGGGGLDDYWDLFTRYPRSMGGAIWDFVSTGITEKVLSLTDGSPNNIMVNAMGRGIKLVNGFEGMGIDLNGHDQWVELYRDKALELAGNSMFITMRVFPRKLNSSGGTLITKGSYQFGIVQVRNDSLVFYLTTRNRNKVQIALPADWENKWHHITAGYDGKSIFIGIDEKKVSRQGVTGSILNTPFPVNIGRDAEEHGQETSVYICDAIIDEAGIFSSPDDFIDAGKNSADFRQNALLWLDFEDIITKGEFFSYGIGARTYGSIWPDRQPQPEMWQIKKSGQPVTFELSGGVSPAVKISNRFMFTNLNEFEGKWIITSEGWPVDSGRFNLDLDPGKSGLMRIPLTEKGGMKGNDRHLKVSFCTLKDTPWAKNGYEVAWEQFSLPEPLQIGEQQDIKAHNVNINNVDGKLVVSGKGFRYVFSKDKGSLDSIIFNGKGIIDKAPGLNLWRAPLANETDEWAFWSSNNKNRTTGFGRFAATEWYSSGLHDSQLTPGELTYSTADDGKAVISVFNIVTQSTRRGAFLNKYIYTIGGDGLLTISHTVIPNGSMPSWLPRIGLEWILSGDLRKVEWFGRGPQENYPDRKSGYAIGLWNSSVDNMYEPYLIPQDHGLRCDNRWVRFTDNSGQGIEFSSSDYFNFNAYPYTTENLTKALYTYQLQPFGSITFNFDYATSGVGCTALSVFPEYQVLPKRYDFITFIRPVEGRK